MLSNSRLLVAVVKLCATVGDWKTLQEHIVLLSKKHGLFKSVRLFLFWE
jgi:26S proteasome regulatory subunit N5